MLRIFDHVVHKINLAAMILMSRNAPDVCLSIYFQNFSVAHGYATDLNDLVHFYQQSIKLINYWRSALPDGILMEVPYEDLVQDPEFWSRKMVEFIAKDLTLCADDV